MGHDEPANGQHVDATANSSLLRDGSSSIDVRGAEEEIKDAFAAGKLSITDALAGKLAKLVFRDAVQLVPGYNEGDSLSGQQLDQLASNYPKVTAALSGARPAKDEKDVTVNITADASFDEALDASEKLYDGPIVKVLSCVFKNKSLALPLVIWCGGLVGMFLFGWYQIKARSTFPIVGYTGCVAKGMARVLELAYAGCVFYMLRIIHKPLIKITFFRVVLGLDEAHMLHQILAVIFFVAGAIHTIFWLAINYPKELDAGICCLYQSYPAISGYFLALLWTCMAVSIGTSIFCRNKYPKTYFAKYRVFLWTHYVFFVSGTIMLLLHPLPYYNPTTPARSTAWYWVTPVIAVWLWSCIKRLAPKYLRKRTRLLEARLLPGPWITLRVEKSVTVVTKHKFRVNSGMYAPICVPMVSPTDWHPFTIVSAPENDFVAFFIKVYKDGWSGKLYRKMEEFYNQNKPAESGDFKGEESLEKMCGIDYPRLCAETLPGIDMPEVLTDGPYVSPLQNPLKRKVTGIVYTAGGVGVTPFLSCIDHQSYMKELPAKIRGKITFIWALRDQHLPAFAQPIWDRVAQSGIRDEFRIRLYMTGVKGLTPHQEAWIRLVQAVGQKHVDLDPVTCTRGGVLDVNFGRPDWKGELNQVGALNKDGNCCVLFCGDERLGKVVKAACKEINGGLGQILTNSWSPYWFKRWMWQKSLKKRAQAGHNNCFFKYIFEKIG